MQVQYLQVSEDQPQAVLHIQKKKTQKYKDMFIGLRIIIGGTQEPIFWFLN